MIPVYNEADIIGYVIEHLISQGVELVIVDNSSTDNSYQICASYVNKGVVWLEAVTTEQFQFDLLVQSLYDAAISRETNWVLLNAADEFLESPYKGLTLKEAIAIDDHNGCDMIQFNNFEFFPTEKDLATEPDVEDELNTTLGTTTCNSAAGNQPQGNSHRDRWSLSYFSQGYEV